MSHKRRHPHHHHDSHLTRRAFLGGGWVAPLSPDQFAGSPQADTQSDTGDTGGDSGTSGDGGGSST